MAHTGKGSKGPRIDMTREAQLNLVRGHLAECLDRIEPDDSPFTDDRHAVAGPLDLADDVR